MAYSFLELDTLQTWVNDPCRPKKLTKANVEYMRKCKELLDEFSINNAMAFFMARKLDIQSCQKILGSSVAQKKFISMVYFQLKEYGVEKKYIPIFERDFKRLENRVKLVRQRLDDNMRFTEYYPFFKEVGFDKLLNIQTGIDTEEFDLQFDEWLEEFETWKKDNQEKVDKHLEDIAFEKHVHERWVAKIKGDKQAEKDAKELIKKQEREEKKFQKEIAKRDAKRRKAEVEIWGLFT